MASSSFKRLAWPALLLILLLIPGRSVLVTYGPDATEAFQRIAGWILGTAIGLSIAWLVVRVIDVLVWSILERRFSAPIPRLLKDIVAGLVFLAAGMTIVGLVFAQSVTGIWATSGVVGIVVGFALRNMIADVFSGIALNVDRPFKIGDWIEVHPRSVQAMRGCVSEISWRSTRIRTTDNTMIVLPNNLISSIVVVNLSVPQTRSRFVMKFCLEFGVPAERALRVLSAGVKAAEGILDHPAPKVLINQATELGIEYKVRYWVEPTWISPRRARHRVTASILQHLHHAGISLAYPKQDLYLAKMPNRQLDSAEDRTELLQRVELFSQLHADEIEKLQMHVHEREYRSDEMIMKKDDPGGSMFVLVEGLLDVSTVMDGESDSVKVEEIEPGEFFGEMSLLTGCPRTATVRASTDAIVYEIGKEAIDELLGSRPELAESMALIVASRREELAAAGKTEPEEELARQQGLADQILERMKGFFGSLRGCFHSL